MVTEEKERVAKQAEGLGEEGLGRKHQELKAAIAQNEVCVIRTCTLMKLVSVYINFISASYHGLAGTRLFSCDWTPYFSSL